MDGKFTYYAKEIKYTGVFNIYQAKNGAIMLVMANRAIILNKTQIDDLGIDCYSLNDFDIDNYNDFYDYYHKF